MTCSDHTTLDGGALRHAPLRLLDLESLCSGRSDQSDWLYQVRPCFLYMGNYSYCFLLGSNHFLDGKFSRFFDIKKSNF